MIELVSYTPVDRPQSSIIALVGVFLPKWDLEVNKLVECRSGDKRWFNYACYVEEKSDGQKEFIKYAGFRSKTTSDSFLSKVRELVDTHLEANPELKPKEPEWDSEELPF